MRTHAVAGVYASHAVMRVSLCVCVCVCLCLSVCVAVCVVAVTVVPRPCGCVPQCLHPPYVLPPRSVAPPPPSPAPRAAVCAAQWGTLPRSHPWPWPWSWPWAWPWHASGH